VRACLLREPLDVWLQPTDITLPLLREVAGNCIEEQAGGAEDAAAAAAASSAGY
jgi:hypothetical protein